jgi:histone H3/H4
MMSTSSRGAETNQTLLSAKKLSNLKLNHKRLHEIRRLQKSEKCHTSKAAVERLIRDELVSLKHGLRLQPTAVEVVQTACEDYLDKEFKMAAAIAAHAGRDTIQPADFKLIADLEKIRNG